MGVIMADSEDANVVMKYLKDAIIVLSFLATIAGLYVKINEQLVRLDQKVSILEEKTKELKETNVHLADKVSNLQTTVNSRP